MMVTIRKMLIEDYDEVYKLWSNISGIGLNDVDDSFEGISRYLTRNPDTSFIAIYEDKFVGAILAGHDGRRGFIYHSAVLPEYRKQGIGRMLVEKVLEALKEQGISKVGLLAFSANELGNQFWESMGFGSRNDCTYRDKKLIEMVYKENPYINGLH